MAESWIGWTARRPPCRWPRCYCRGSSGNEFMNVTVLGATGSIGASTLDVLARHPERYRVFALTAHAGAEALLELCRRHRPRYAVLSGVAEDRTLKEKFAPA